ncbi:Uncharacterised protein [uncultured archaeon]|nr:Uncharacterised protein [uncultured archaeon]
MTESLGILKSSQFLKLLSFFISSNVTGLLIRDTAFTLTTTNRSLSFSFGFGNGLLVISIIPTTRFSPPV